MQQQIRKIERQQKKISDLKEEHHKLLSLQDTLTLNSLYKYEEQLLSHHETIHSIFREESEVIKKQLLEKEKEIKINEQFLETEYYAYAFPQGQQKTQIRKLHPEEQSYLPYLIAQLKRDKKQLTTNASHRKKQITNLNLLTKQAIEQWVQLVLDDYRRLILSVQILFITLLLVALFFTDTASSYPFFFFLGLIGVLILLNEAALNTANRSDVCLDYTENGIPTFVVNESAQTVGNLSRDSFRKLPSRIWGGIPYALT